MLVALAKLKIKIGWWIYCYCPIYINSLNPFKAISDWCKCKRYFLAPDVKFWYGHSLEVPTMFYTFRSHRWFEIYIRNTVWKWKFDDTCFEENPGIFISFRIPKFSKWKITFEPRTLFWDFRSPAKRTYTFCGKEYTCHLDDEYWGSIIYYLYEYPYKHHIDKPDKAALVDTYENNKWDLHSKDKPVEKITIDNMLTDIGYIEVHQYDNLVKKLES